MTTASENAARSKTPAAVQCDGKVGFLTYRLATDVAKARKRAKGRKRQVYKCHFCNQYHLGHGIRRVYRPAGKGGNLKVSKA